MVDSLAFLAFQPPDYKDYLVSAAVYHFSSAFSSYYQRFAAYRTIPFLICPNETKIRLVLQDGMTLLLSSTYTSWSIISFLVNSRNFGKRFSAVSGNSFPAILGSFYLAYTTRMYTNTGFGNRHMEFWKFQKWCFHQRAGHR